MEIYDVIIIGAGPAGCFSAYEICRVVKKPKILILEASPTLERMKPCGGQIDIVSLNRVPELKKILVGKSYRHLKYYNNKKFGEARAVDYCFTRSKSNISLDYYFPKIIEKMGITVITDSRVTDIDNSKKGYAIVSCNEKKYYGKIVVDASGAMSTFNHKLVGGKKIGELDKFFCSMIEFKLKGENKKTILKLFENDKFVLRNDLYSGDPMGLYWIFYYQDIDSVNIGNGFTIKKGEKIDTRSKLIDFLKSKKLKDWNTAEIKSWVAPIELQKKLYTNHVLWIGDSAGMVNPFSGNGIPNSSAAAEVIAEVCNDALSKNDFSKETLKHYEEHPKMKKFISNTRKKIAFIKFAKKIGVNGPGGFLNVMSDIGELMYKKELLERLKSYD
jgi:digeranylgeranylglycerophospholipid reductase